jgi:putative ABC transport system substrate-binding protein
VDGQNIVFDRRFAAGDDGLIEGFVADLVRRPVDIIVATGTREVVAAKQATSSIPIVTFITPDPIGMGFAQSLARPSGNVTGLTTMDVEIYGKRTELLKQNGAQGLVVTSDGVYVALGKPLAESAIKHRLPGIFAFREQVRAGGLLAYAAKIEDLSRRAAFFVDRIVRGERPAELPIERPTKFELVINLKTAKSFGVEMPPSLLALADEVIE